MVTDKIYCEKCSDGMYSHTDIWDGGDNVAYIRKDALLEWAEEMKDAWEDYADTSYYQEFIDKINSM